MTAHQSALLHFVVVLGLATSASAAILSVAPDGTGDYPTIQAALNVASDGDVVQLAPGNYYGLGNTNLEFYGDVTVRGVGEPRLTVINCGGSASTPRGGFRLYEETGGTVANLTVQGAWGAQGGAIVTGWGNYTFQNCRFLDNHAARGGVWFGDQYGAVLFEDCVFARNSADSYGGALAATDETVLTVRSCTFTNNAAGEGAGVSLETGASAVIETTIMAWNAGGGAAINNYGGSFSITCCNFFGNNGGDFPYGTADDEGNFSADPRLVDPWGDDPDVDLAESSPCRADIACDTMGAGEELDVDGCCYRLEADGSGMLASIQAAVDLVQVPQDEIVLEDGVYFGAGNENITNDLRSFTLRSRSNNPANCRLEPDTADGLTHRHMSLTGIDASIRLRGLGFHGGYAAFMGCGGSLRISSTTPDPGITMTINNCVFRDNMAGDTGGAIDMIHGTLTMEDTIFEMNSANDTGGAIFTKNVLVQANVCRLDGNMSENYAAGWLMQNPLEGSFLMEVDVGNHSGQGVKVQALDHVLHVTSCLFWDNESMHGGAGLHVTGFDGQDLVLQDCEFHGNVSQQSWGGGLAAGTRFTALNCRFLNNRAKCGGGLSGGSDYGRLDGCTFTGNIADQDEDAFGGGATMGIGVVSDCVFENNTAVNGGGLHVEMLEAPLHDCTFRDNTASQFGGGVYAEGSITECTFSGNEAYIGAGAYFTSGDAEYCVFTHNSAVRNGAALFLEDGGRLLQSTLVYNSITGESIGGQVAVGRIGIPLLPTSPSLRLNKSIVAFGQNSSVMEWFITDYSDPWVQGPSRENSSCYASLIWEIEHGISTTGNFDSSSCCIQTSPPGFCDAAAGDLTLFSNSRALPSNNDCYELMGYYEQGCEAIVGVEDEPELLRVTLLSNYPNPFNPSTSVSFSLNHDGHAVLEIVNLKGERVRVLVDESLTAGPHTVTWDGRDTSGRALPSGVYLSRLVTEGSLEVRRMALIR
jgi:predicted outer membrane repeat protein